MWTEGTMHIGAQFLNATECVKINLNKLFKN